MKKINVKIVGDKTHLPLKRRVKNLISNYETHINSSNKLESVTDDINIGKYDLIIITNEEVHRLGKKLNTILGRITSASPRIQILLLVDEKNVDIGVKALSAGSYQYIKHPVSNNELKLVIETAIDQRPQLLENHVPDSEGKSKFGEIIGGSQSMQLVYDQILQAAKTDIPILILGETGTGKDLVSYTIHKTSLRSDDPYLAVNLGALPSELVSSELFGHEKGAFTGATHLHKGVFEQGSSGTVFLDEIDTIDEKVQVSLLRLIEQKKFKRLGGTKSITTKARLIAATNDNLEDLVDAGIFRTDLYYRLDVFRITLPPLRERKDDIPLIVEELLIRYARHYKKNISSISKNSIEALMNFDWPGNVRELKNVIQRAVIVCNGKSIQIKHLPKRFSNIRDASPTITIKSNSTLNEVERKMIIHALKTSNNNKKEAANQLGISRRALYNKLNKHRI